MPPAPLPPPLIFVPMSRRCRLICCRLLQRRYSAVTLPLSRRCCMMLLLYDERGSSAGKRWQRLRHDYWPRCLPLYVKMRVSDTYMSLSVIKQEH